MSRTVIPLVDHVRIHEPYRERLLAVFLEALKKGHLDGSGAAEKFEAAFARLCGTAHCMALNNGSSAKVMALRLLGVQAGDEVLLPAFLPQENFQAVMELGAHPRWVDVDGDTAMMNPAQLATRRTSTSKAIFFTHAFGQRGHVDLLKKAMGAGRLPIAEDATHSMGAVSVSHRQDRDRDIICFAFSASSNLASLGSAGALVGDFKDSAGPVHQMAQSYRMDALQAQFLYQKIGDLVSQNTQRRDAAAYYMRQLQPFSDVSVLGRTDPAHVYYRFVVRVPFRDKLFQHLQAQGIETEIPFQWLRGQAWMTENPVADELLETCICLPLWPGIKESQQDKVVAGIKQFAK